MYDETWDGALFTAIEGVKNSSNGCRQKDMDLKGEFIFLSISSQARNDDELENLSLLPWYFVIESMYNSFLHHFPI